MHRLLKHQHLLAGGGKCEYRSLMWGREDREQWIRQKYEITPSQDMALGKQLISAATAGDLVSILRLHSDGVSMDAQDEVTRRTALHEAVQADNALCALLLLLNGADPNATDNDGNTPLHIAAQKGHFPSLRMLIRYRAEDARNNAGYTAMELAINGQHEQCVHLLQALERREALTL